MKCLGLGHFTNRLSNNNVIDQLTQTGQGNV